MSLPHQQLIDIGDRAVCVRVRGSGPTVVLEAGGAGDGGEGTTGAYGVLEERLASFATVLTYDRAGSGRSDGPAHRHVAEMADDLHSVIQQMECAVPVVVVGWSIGGLVAEMFAVRHPDSVAGVRHTRRLSSAPSNTAGIWSSYAPSPLTYSRSLTRSGGNSASEVFHNETICRSRASAVRNSKAVASRPRVSFPKHLRYQSSAARSDLYMLHAASKSSPHRCSSAGSIGAIDSARNVIQFASNCDLFASLRAVIACLGSSLSAQNVHAACCATQRPAKSSALAS
jgi:pimeloyl-ACP methyl ester carboxylesterase